ncbi:guanine nucleotide exchange factor DBS-like isoform X3 [Cylas formicarius]|uniref:guanine nucleotide exchange factor DBS-like isoform X3 n=1 Tax=Cylas formicarius TaxID=197179 RepID=UPI0029584853|nr:guanine nucleotide exchange factor DBS-like isoform X3 [Cylas formicarius]
MWCVSCREEPLPSCEEFEMQNTVNLEPLGVNDVVDLLQQHYGIISGGKTKDGCPIITFPDNNNFQMLTDSEYQRLMLYLTSVPTLQEADMGFHLIIDRRKDRWNSVKAVLLKISVYFPGLIHVVYVLRPASFLQKALSEVSNKLFKDEFKFRMIVLSTVEELHEYIHPSQLTTDLKGTLPYNHDEWIYQRIELENFSAITQQVSNALDEFTKSVDETELPNNVDSTQELLNKQTEFYSDLKKEILSTAKAGEDLLSSIKKKNSNNDSGVPDMVGNVFAVERLLVQLEETETTFDDFWQQHSQKLRQCLNLRRFEQDFRELQSNFDVALKTVSEMTEIGETVARVDTLIKETNAFEKICESDVQRAEEVISSGQLLMIIKNSCPLECVEPKCSELIRMREMLLTRLSKRKEMLQKCRELMERVEKANKWCASGIDLLASQKIEICSNSPDLAEKYLIEIREFTSSSNEFTANGQKDFKDIFQDSITPETKALVSQVLQRIEDVSLMCDKRVSSLNKIAVRNKRPVQTVIPEPAVPRQPLMGAPQPTKAALKKAHTVSKMDSANDGEQDSNHQNGSGIPQEVDELNRIKTRHVLAELLETEKVYVTEVLSVIKGYKLEAQLEEHQHLLSSNVGEKFDIIFGNLDDIYRFHSEVFLRDLENCITSTDLVALCFVQKRDNFFRLYSFYCQNIAKSEQLRESSTDLNQFFQVCQRKLGHKLPLAAYLLKPVQRITKYQLLLRDLLRYSEEGKCCKELQQALDCMLVVLKCVNDSMHQISITGFPGDLSQQGELLLQGSFNVWVENKKDLRLRLKALRRHLFLYQKALLFCKPVSKAERNKATYQFKHYLKMSQIGLTESVKGDPRKFEVWLQGRQEVHTIQATNLEQKQAWVNEIKRVLFNQLEEIKGEKIKQYAAITHKPLRQTTSWETQKHMPITPAVEGQQRALSCDSEPPNIQHIEEAIDCMEGGNWSSDGSNSDDDEHSNQVSRGRYVVLADYCAIGNSEVNMREGDIVELMKVGCAGWWFVKVVGGTVEGWAPAAYLESLSRKAFRGGSRSQDKLNEH